MSIIRFVVLLYCNTICEIVSKLADKLYIVEVQQQDSGFRFLTGRPQILNSMVVDFIDRLIISFILKNLRFYQVLFRYYGTFLNR